MVVGCPKCKAKLKIPDEKIKPEGSKFKCPKCTALLLVKKPSKRAAPTPPPSKPRPAAPPPPPPQRTPAPQMKAPAPPAVKPIYKEEEPWPELPPEPPAEERIPWPEEPAPRREEPAAPTKEHEPWPEFPPESPVEEQAPWPEEPSAEKGEPWPELPPEPPSEEMSPWPEEPVAREEQTSPWPEEPSTHEEQPATWPEEPAPPPPAEEPPSFEEPAPSMEPIMEPPAPPTKEVAAPVAPPVEAAPKAEAPAEARKVLLAHADPKIVNMLKFVLSGANFNVLSANDGVAAMMTALKEQPAAIIVDVRLPKIHGVEVMKRLATRNETKDAKVILVGTKPEAQVPPIKGSSGYIHEDRLQQGLVAMIKKALEAPAPTAPAVAAPVAGAKPGAPAAAATGDVARAERFCRTIFADIDLYNKEQVAAAVKAHNFEGAFAKEIAEGKKLYEMRIADEVRSQGDFFNDAMHTFIEKKKKQLGL